MINKKAFLAGILIGLAAPFIIIGLIYSANFANYSFPDFVELAIAQHLASAIIALSIVINLGIFFILMKINREMASRGVILATLLWGILVIYFKFGS